MATTCRQHLSLAGLHHFGFFPFAFLRNRQTVLVFAESWFLLGLWWEPASGSLKNPTFLAKSLKLADSEEHQKSAAFGAYSGN